MSVSVPKVACFILIIIPNKCAKKTFKCIPLICIMFISLTIAETENCSLQKKEKILEANRNKKACDPKINYGIYYVCVRVCACCDAMSEIVFRLFYIYILLLVNVVILK